MVCNFLLAFLWSYKFKIRCKWRTWLAVTSCVSTELVTCDMWSCHGDWLNTLDTLLPGLHLMGVCPMSVSLICPSQVSVLVSNDLGSNQLNKKYDELSWIKEYVVLQIKSQYLWGLLVLKLNIKRYLVLGSSELYLLLQDLFCNFLPMEILGMW